MVVNKPYLVVLITFGIGLGIFNTITTLIAQVVAPVGISEDNAGILGGIIVGVGLVSAGVTAPILDKFHKYKEFYVAAFVLVSIAFTWLALVLLWKSSFVMVALPFAFLGLAAFMLLPTALELSVETTYPAPAATSAGFLWMMGQVLGIVMLEVCQALTAPDGNMQNAVWFMLAFIGLGTLISLCLIYPFTARYKRLAAETKPFPDINGDNRLSV